MSVTTRRCAIYTRKSSDEGLEQAFNSLDAQREACLAFIASQKGEGWKAISARYDDGGFSGGSMDRPALKQLLADVGAGLVDVIVVYKVDRLTRSLMDFAKIVEQLDGKGVSFVSVTQQFNTTSSMGRLTLNVLLSFAQFEREVTGERIRDKFAASKKKGMWMGGTPPLGYAPKDRTLTIVPDEADLVCLIFRQYLELKSVNLLKRWLDTEGHRSKRYVSKTGKDHGGLTFFPGALYAILQNQIYLGRIVHKDQNYAGMHEAIIDQETWDTAQALLAQNRNDHASRAFIKEPSLLAGLLYDSRGERLVPSHTLKAGKRYRYYCVPNLKCSADRPITRVPGHDLEILAIAALQAFLRDGEKLANLLKPLRLAPSAEKALVRQAGLLASAWAEATSVDQLAIIKRIVNRVMLEEHDLSIEIAAGGLVSLLISRDKDTDPLSIAALKRLGDRPVVLTAQAKLKRCGSELRLVIANEKPGDRPARPNPALIKAVARAHVWREQIVAGKARNLAEIATSTGLTQRYVHNMLRLAHLSPRVVEMILEGKQPLDLMLEDLVAGLPLDWRSQDQRFGLSA